MGRPAKPAELKKRIGTARPDRERKPLSILPGIAEIPKAPTGLKRRGREAWKRYWSLGPAWLSTTTDLNILTRLCQAYDEREDLREIVSREGYTTRGSMGQLVAHPAVGMLRAIEGQITRWESLCGFTPSDRSRLGMAEVQRVSKLDQFLSRQAAGR